MNIHIFTQPHSRFPFLFEVDNANHSKEKNMQSKGSYTFSSVYPSCLISVGSPQQSITMLQPSSDERADQFTEGRVILKQTIQFSSQWLFPLTFREKNSKHEFGQQFSPVSPQETLSMYFGTVRCFLEPY